MAFITDVLRDTIARIEVKTTLGPPIVIDDPFAPSGGEPSLAVRTLRPSIALYDRSGALVYDVAPAGSPGVSKWPLVIFGVGVLIALNVHGLVRRR